VLGVIVALTAGCETKTTVVSAPDARGGIAVSGTGTVTVVPDIARLNIGVEARGRTVAEARQGAARAMEAVRTSVMRNGVEDRDLKTQSLNIRPEYGSKPVSTPAPAPPNGGRPQVVPSGEQVIVGYVASITVLIKVRNIDSASKVLDDAVAAGGDETRVNGIAFAVDTPERFQAEARELAMKDARDRAEALAANAGVKLGKPRSITESLSVPRPVALANGVTPARTGSASTPIDPGESEVTINVNVTYEIN
jgi:uncharacterized protein YggE